jgi:hypothetical protein
MGESFVTAGPYKPRKPNYRRHKQTPTKRRERSQEYRRNKWKESAQAKRRYRRYRTNSTFKRKRREYRRNPNKFKMKQSPRKTAGVETMPLRVFDCDGNPVLLYGLTPEGQVAASLFDGRRVLVSPAVVLRTLQFESESDIDQFVSALEDELDLTSDDVEAALLLHGLEADGLSDDVEEALDQIAEFGSRTAGDIIRYDVTPPSTLLNRDRRDGPAREKPEVRKRPYQEQGEGQWTLSQKDMDRAPTAPLMEPNESYYGSSSGKVIPPHLKHAATEGSVFRTFLNVHEPIFHACTAKQFQRILRFGLYPNGQYMELQGLVGLSFTYDFNLLQGNPYARPIILVYDDRELAQRYDIEDTGIDNGVGGTHWRLRHGFISPRHLRGFIVHNRLYSAKSRFIPLTPSYPIPAERAPVSPEYGL